MANYNLFDAASLAMVPVGYKANKLYSVKPDTGAGDFDFSRASYATRVNADGLIEKERGNKLTYSNDFSNAAWVKLDVSVTSGQSGYDGSSDAWRLTNSGSFGNLLQDYAISGVQTFSVYAKADAVNWMWIRIDTSGTQQGQYFDLANGVLGATGTNIDAKIEAVGSTGWYRCSVTYNATSVRARIYPALADDGAGQLSGSIYIQDAQLEQGLVATEYIETTTAPIYKGVTDNIPRIDYTSGCGSLLLEPSRTNLLPDSEYIANWSGANTTIVTNVTTSPEGLQNAHSVTFASGGYWYKSVTISYTAGQAYSWSIYTTTQDTITRWGGSTPAGTDTLSIEDAGNGWYRQTLTRVVSGSGTANFQPLMDAVFVGVGTTFYVYGAQLEAGSYPTSYIPTYGSSVTRLLDNPYILSQSSLIGQTEGTVYAELKSAVTTPLGSFFISISDGTSNNRVLIGYAAAANSFRVVVIFSGVSNGGNNYSITDSTEFLKVAVKYTESSVDVFINGVKQISQSGGSFSGTLNKITFDNGTGANKFEGSIKQRFNFTTALTDNELAALTRPYDTYQEWVDGEGLTWESKTCTTQSILELQNL